MTITKMGKLGFGTFLWYKKRGIGNVALMWLAYISSKAFYSNVSWEEFMYAKYLKWAARRGVKPSAME